jgi:hypothetical protein
MGRPWRRSGRLGAGFWTLWTAGVVSNLGDGVSYVAWPWLAGTLTRDPLLIAGLPIATRLPWLLLAVAGLAPAHAAIGLTASGAVVAAAYVAEGV